MGMQMRSSRNCVHSILKWQTDVGNKYINQFKLERT